MKGKGEEKGRCNGKERREEDKGKGWDTGEKMSEKEGKKNYKGVSGGKKRK